MMKQFISVTVLFFLALAVVRTAAAFDVIPSLGGGAVTAQGNDPRFFWKGGLRVSGQIYRDLSYEVAGAYSSYHISYDLLSKERVRYFMLNSAGTDEAKYDYSADLRYPVWRDYLRIEILGGFRGLYLDNDVTVMSAGGPHAGIAATKEYSFGAIALRGGITPFLYSNVDNKISRSNLVKQSDSHSINLYGDPDFLADYSLTYWLPKFKAVYLGIGYEGETLQFQRTDRYYSGLSLYVKY